MPSRWEDGGRAADLNPYTDTLDASYPQARWIEALQNDFAARADWCVMEYDDANHAPVVTFDHPSDLSAARGETVGLRGVATDPDGDALSIRWWQYGEVDTYAGDIVIRDPGSAAASFAVPEDARLGDTMHVILEVTDAGTPALTRYRRVVVTVRE
jgi:hypothetical protein